jgi:hypothetical protein
MLQKDISYRMMVTSVHQKREFQKDNRTWFNYNVTFVDSAGVPHLTEFVCAERNQPHFLANEYQCFQVIGFSPAPYETPLVVPRLGCDQTAERAMLPGSIRPLAGESYAVGLGLAVRLVGAVLNKGEVPDLDSLDEKALEKVFSLADEFDIYLINKQAQRVLGE